MDDEGERIARILLDPHPLPEIAAARDYGIDLTLLASAVRMTPKERLARAERGRRALIWIEKVRRENGL
jgi:hypothetical protein